MDTLPSFEDTQPISGQQPSADSQQQALPSFEDTQPVEASAQSQEQLPAFDDTHPVDQFTTPSQQAETGIEGFARGITGGLSDVLAKGMRDVASKVGVSDENLHYIAPDPEEMHDRKVANPIESGATEFAGNIALLSKLPQMVGSKAIDGLIKMGVLGATDELSKSAMGHGDPLPAVAAHVAENGAWGLLGGKLASKAAGAGGKVLESLEQKQLGNKLPSFLSGVGHAATFPEYANKVVPLDKSAMVGQEVAGASNAMFKEGQKFFNNIVGSLKGTMSGAATYLGYKVAGPAGGVASKGIEKGMEKLLSPVASKASQKVLAPMILKAAASGPVKNVGQIVDHATSLTKGWSAITNAVENVFNAGVNKATDLVPVEKQREKLKDYIENGGINQNLQPTPDQPQSYADGGSVAGEPENEIEKHWPTQNIMINATRSRVANYLNSIRPVKNINKLPFDSHHDNTKKEQEYNKVLDLANQPLSILNHVKDGSLTPKLMQAFSSMYPDLHQHLSNKLVEKITDHQMDDTKKPPHRVRQALSLFVGNSLSSSLTPMGIQAAQASFADQTARRQSAVALKSISKIGSSSQTPGQAREERLSKD